MTVYPDLHVRRNEMETDRGRSSSFNTGRIDHLFNNPEIYGKSLFLHYGDLTDSSNLNRLLEETEPDEIYPVFS